MWQCQSLHKVLIVSVWQSGIKKWIFVMIDEAQSVLHQVVKTVLKVCIFQTRNLFEQYFSLSSVTIDTQGVCETIWASSYSVSLKDFVSPSLLPPPISDWMYIYHVKLVLCRNIAWQMCFVYKINVSNDMFVLCCISTLCMFLRGRTFIMGVSSAQTK